MSAALKTGKLVTGRRTSATTKPQAAEPAAPEEPAADDDARFVHGLRVVADEPFLSPLSKPGKQPIHIYSFRTLTLEDGSTVVGCSDCPDVVGTKGEITAHRIRQHGYGKSPGGSRPRRLKEADVETPDPPVELAEMTLGEIVELAQQAANWGTVMARQQEEIDKWKQRAIAAEGWRRRTISRLSSLGFAFKEDGDV